MLLSMQLSQTTAKILQRRDDIIRKMKNALIIFIKTPIPGLVKTRLQPQLTKEESAELYAAFLKDLDHKFYNQKEFDSYYAVSPENFEEIILSRLVHLDNYFFQEGEDLGERMNYAFQSFFSKGYEKIVLIGSDLPSITPGIVSQAIHGLETNDCVLGPSKDGGYYLIALSRSFPFLFDDLPWSTSEVLGKTIDILNKKRFTYKLLQELEDIDTYTELLAFYEDQQDKLKEDSEFPINSWSYISKFLSHRK